MVVRNEYERRYTPRGYGFAPPQHGTVISTEPPQLDAPSRFPAYPDSDRYAAAGNTYYYLLVTRPSRPDRRAAMCGSFDL
jgi:hypothetical protein